MPHWVVFLVHREVLAGVQEPAGEQIEGHSSMSSSFLSPDHLQQMPEPWTPGRQEPDGSCLVWVDLAGPDLLLPIVVSDNVSKNGDPCFTHGPCHEVVDLPVEASQHLQRGRTLPVGSLYLAAQALLDLVSNGGGGVVQGVEVQHLGQFRRNHLEIICVQLRGPIEINGRLGCQKGGERSAKANGEPHAKVGNGSAHHRGRCREAEDNLQRVLHRVATVRGHDAALQDVQHITQV
jgi:hypothetical protein